MADSRMTDPKEPLILDLLAWIAAMPRPYAEVMDLWRTSCPRLTVWEDATERGLITCEARGDTLFVVATPRGEAALKASSSKAASPDDSENGAEQKDRAFAVSRSERRTI